MMSPFLGKLGVRRRRVFLLKNGYHLEIAWHYGRQMMVAEFTSPSGQWELVYSHNVHELMGKVRLGIAEMVDPNVRAVRLRMTQKTRMDFEKFVAIYSEYLLDDECLKIYTYGNFQNRKFGENK